MLLLNLTLKSQNKFKLFWTKLMMAQLMKFFKKDTLMQEIHLSISSMARCEFFSKKLKKKKKNKLELTNIS